MNNEYFPCKIERKILPTSTEQVGTKKTLVPISEVTFADSPKLPPALKIPRMRIYVNNAQISNLMEVKIADLKHF